MKSKICKNEGFLKLSLFQICQICLIQEGKSTEHEILDLYTNVIQSVQKQEKLSCIFLEFLEGI